MNKRSRVVLATLVALGLAVGVLVWRGGSAVMRTVRAMHGGR